MHKLFPPFMHGARMISQVIFTDVALVNKLRLEEMHLKTDELLKTIVALNTGTVLPAAGATPGRRRERCVVGLIFGHSF